jgi:hypothetical protein
MDSPSVKVNEALGSPLLKSMAYHVTLVHQKIMNLVTPFVPPTHETMHQLPKRTNIDELGKSTNWSTI